MPVYPASLQCCMSMPVALNLVIHRITWDFTPPSESLEPASVQSIQNQSMTWVPQTNGACLIGILAALVMSVMGVSARRVDVVRRHPGQRPASDDGNIAGKGTSNKDDLMYNPGSDNSNDKFRARSWPHATTATPGTATTATAPAAAAAVAMAAAAAVAAMAMAAAAAVAAKAAPQP